MPRSPVFHGGNLAQAEQRFGRPSAGWLDLSTGINPWPYPLAPFAPESLTRLPDAGAMDGLIAAAAHAYRVADPACVVAAPGTQAILQNLPRLIGGRRRVAVVGPTYAEHARAWASAGHHVIEVADPEAEAEVVVVVNPNNPDGRTVALERLRQLADRQAERGGWLVVDGAFVDVASGIDVSAEAGRPGLVVLRSFGKFYGLAGLRLGFALCEAALATRLTEALGPWAVAGPAVAAGTQALADDAWAAEMRLRLTDASHRLDRLLDDAGLGVVGGTPLFRLIDSPQAGALYEFLARRGILTRPFPARPGWLRFGLPGPGAGRLAAALAAFAGRAQPATLGIAPGG